MLGPEQSGFIDTVGIDMYIEMLEEAIKQEKGEEISIKEDKEVINVAVDGYLPKNFTPDDFDKISMYQDIDKMTSLEDLENLRNSVIDEYGKLPKVVSSLFDKKKLEILISYNFVEKYREIKGISEVIFTKEYSDRLNGIKLFEIFTGISKDITLKYIDNKIIVRIPKINDKFRVIFDVILKSEEALNENW